MWDPLLYVFDRTLTLESCFLILHEYWSEHQIRLFVASSLSGWLTDQAWEYMTTFIIDIRLSPFHIVIWYQVISLFPPQVQFTFLHHWYDVRGPLGVNMWLETWQRRGKCAWTHTHTHQTLHVEHSENH